MNPNKLHMNHTPYVLLKLPITLTYNNIFSGEIPYDSPKKSFCHKYSF